jgi:hypothetical protein
MIATTLEYDGTEKSLGAWGFAKDSCRCEHVNGRPSTYTAFLPGGEVADDPIVPFEGKVIIRRNRSGSDTTWTGGYTAFIGYQVRVGLSAMPGEQGVDYIFANAWYLVENTPYQQYYASRNTTSHALEYKPLSEFILFSRLDGSNLFEKIDSGEQIEEALQLVSDMAVAAGLALPFDIGTIDPALDLPTYQAKEMMCDGVIQTALQLSPDAVVVFDYVNSGGTANTPKIHVLSRSSRTSKSLAIANGTDHKALSIVKRNDLVPRAVVITYKYTGSDDGSEWIIYQPEKYGPNGLNNGSDPDGGLRVVLQTVELLGRQTTSVSASIVTQACNATHATDATRLAWWKEKHQYLNSAKIDSLVIAAAGITVADPGGSVSLATYPNELIEGQIANWMEFEQKYVTITAKGSWTEYHDTAKLIVSKKIVDKVLTVRCVVTDGTTGDYSTLASSTSAEAKPVGLAQALYTSLATPQFEGSDIRVQGYIANATGDGPFVTLANKLNLTGGRTEWETMNAQIQSIIETDGNGTTQISFGPARHLSAGDLNSIFQFNKFRRVWYNRLLRETADLGSGDAVTFGADVPKENSTEGAGSRKEDAASHTFTG